VGIHIRKHNEDARMAPPNCHHRNQEDTNPQPHLQHNKMRIKAMQDLLLAATIMMMHIDLGS
jgi:hypothetical protein